MNAKRDDSCSCAPGTSCERCMGKRDAYPWDQCVSDQLDKGYDKESADKICGYIKAKYGAGSRATRAVSATMRRSFPIATDAVDRATRTVKLVASTAAFLPTTVVRNGEAEEVPLSIQSWDLSRAANGLVPVLWAHDKDSIPLGTIREISDAPEGLLITAHIPEGFTHSAEKWRALEQGLVKGVSVGFGPGDDTFEERDGQLVGVRRNAKLLEVSIVPVPQDDGAMVATPPRPETAEERSARIKRAAADLARSRKRSDAADCVTRFDGVHLAKFTRTPSGGLRIPARLARTGVLVYRNPDGTERRELRLPEEVFHADSLESLRSATVTDIAHHGDLINPRNWRDAALGHVENIRADANKFVAGDVLIQDQGAIDKLERGELKDVSAGYTCRLEPTAGEWKGQRYDGIQRDIRYNHVAVLPPGRGRSGAEVGLRLDSTDAVCVTPQEIDMKTIVVRVDGKDVELEYGSKDHIAHIESDAQKRLDAKEAEHKKSLDSLQGRFDALEVENKDLKTKLAAAVDPTVVEKRITERASLLQVAGVACGAEFKADGLSDREIRIAVIRSFPASKDFDGKDKSDEYVQARYDAVSGLVKRSDGIDNAVEEIRNQQRADAASAGEPDAEAKAKADMQNRNRKVGREPLK